MSTFATQLFEGERIRLTALDLEKDAEVVARWTHDPAYGRLTSSKPARPLSPLQVKKAMEEQVKDAREKRQRFDFAIRLKAATPAEERLVGLATIEGIEWTHGHGWLSLSLGAAADRGMGYGGEALKLILRYAFHELNLYRLNAIGYEDNARGLAFLQRHGFAIEVRRREAIYRAGRRWDEVRLGLLREDWERSVKRKT